jgi:hypothetical protein
MAFIDQLFYQVGRQSVHCICDSADMLAYNFPMWRGGGGRMLPRERQTRNLRSSSCFLCIHDEKRNAACSQF